MEARRSCRRTVPQRSRGESAPLFDGSHRHLPRPRGVRAQGERCVPIGPPLLGNPANGAPALPSLFCHPAPQGCQLGVSSCMDLSRGNSRFCVSARDLAQAQEEILSRSSDGELSEPYRRRSRGITACRSASLRPAVVSSGSRTVSRASTPP